MAKRRKKSEIRAEASRFVEYQWGKLSRWTIDEIGVVLFNAFQGLRQAIRDDDLEAAVRLAFQAGLALGHAQAARKRKRRLGASRKATAAGTAEQARKLFDQIPEKDRRGRRTRIYQRLAQQLGVKPRTIRAYLSGRTGND